MSLWQSDRVLRPHEWVVVGFFSYCAALAIFLDVRPGIREVALAVNTAVIAGQFLLAWAHQLRYRGFLGIMRDWYALPLMLLAYREMGWFAPPVHTFELEQSWIVYDRLLLHDWHFRAAIESLGPVLPALLEICYTLVYTIAPFCMGYLYYRRKTRLVREFLLQFLLGIYISYLLFPLFPSEPPRSVFPGADLPTVDTVFRRFNLAMLGTYGIHLSVFPSAHCSGSFAAAFAMRRLLPAERRVWISLFVLASGIAIATVYGRYHYAVDAVAGIAVAVFASLILWHKSPTIR